MKFLRIVAVAAAVVASGFTAQANLVTYTFNGNFSPSNVDPNLSAQGFGDAGSKAQVGLGEVDGKKYGYVLLRDRSTSSNSAASNKQYGQFTIEQISGFQGQISSITFQAARAGDFSGNGLAIRWSYDNYSSDLGSVTVNNGPSNFNNFTINFRQPLIFGGIVTFRIYAFSSREGQSLRFRNLTLNGTIVEFAPDTGPPDVTVFGNSLTKRTRKVNYTLSGRATDENTVRVVEVASKKSGPWEAAEGTAPWKFTTKLARGVNKFFVRATDFAGSTSDPIKVTVRYTGPGKNGDSSSRRNRNLKRR